MHSYAALDQLAGQHRSDLLAEAEARRLYRIARQGRRARRPVRSSARAAPPRSEPLVAACA